MRDLYSIFKEMERGPQIYQPSEFEDTDLPFDKILEIAEELEDDSVYDDE